MKRFIFTERGGIYIIDLQQTQQLVEDAYDFARNIAERGGTILFVGTKKQAQDAVRTEATRVGMPFVSNRWLGGLLTNWRTISDRIAYLHDLRRLKTDGQLALLPAKERITMEAELEKLEANLGGVADMKRQPDAIFIVDLKKEALAVREAQRLHLPVIALVDTNCDPDEAEYMIPGNDDAIRSCSLIVRAIADGIAAGQSKVSEKDFAAKAAAAEAAAAREAEAAAQAEDGGRGARRRGGRAGERPATSRRSRASARPTPRSCAAPASPRSTRCSRGARPPEGRAELVEQTGHRRRPRAALGQSRRSDPGRRRRPRVRRAARGGRSRLRARARPAQRGEPRHRARRDERGAEPRRRVPGADEVTDWIEQAKALPRIVAH